MQSKKVRLPDSSPLSLDDQDVQIVSCMCVWEDGILSVVMAYTIKFDLCALVKSFFMYFNRSYVLPNDLHP